MRIELMNLSDNRLDQLNASYPIEIEKISEDLGLKRVYIIVKELNELIDVMHKIASPFHVLNRENDIRLLIINKEDIGK